MPQVVRDPRGQQLPQRDRAELGVLALERELDLGQPPPGERGQVVRAQPSKLVEQLGERLSLTLAELGEAVVGREAPVRALREDELRARDPICALAVDEMTHDDVRTPRVRALGRVGPRRGERGQHRAQRARRALEDCSTLLEVELHRLSPIRNCGAPASTPA